MESEGLQFVMILPTSFCAIFKKLSALNGSGSYKSLKVFLSILNFITSSITALLEVDFPGGRRCCGN